MITNQFKLSVSEARAWDEDHKSDYLPLTEGALNQLPTKHRRGWTPAPDTTQLRRYEPPAKHGRDIGSLIRYHEAHKKGRTDDDALRDKFGSGVELGCKQNNVVGQTGITAGPTLERHSGGPDATEKFAGRNPAPTPPRGDIEGRVWKNRAPKNICETCYEHWRAVLVGGKMFTRGAWNEPGVWSGKARDVHSVFELEADGYPEIFGPERDVVIAECRKAMGI